MGYRNSGSAGASASWMIFERMIRLRTPVSVERSDGVLFEARQDEKGIYKVRNGELVPDLSYRLNFALEGKSYQSTFLKPLFAPEIDSLSYQKKGREEVGDHSCLQPCRKG